MPPALALVPTTPTPDADAARRADSALLLEDFLQGLRPSTAGTYRKALGAVAAAWPCALDDLPAVIIAAGRGALHRRVRHHMAELLNNGASPAYANVRLGALRSLVRYLRDTDEIDWLLTVRSARVVAYKDTAGPGLEAVRRLLATAAANPRPRQAARDVALLRVAVDHALRSGEITRITMDGLERAPDGAAVAVWIRGKGRHERERLLLTPAAANAVTHWLAARGEAPGRLFRCGTRAFANVLDRLAVRAQVPRTHPHGLRHTSISLACTIAGGDPTAVTAFARHGRFDVTLRYLDNLRDVPSRVAAGISALV